MPCIVADEPAAARVRDRVDLALDARSRAAVNQTSPPSGDHARPCTVDQPGGESRSSCRRDRTIATVPSSPSPGWSRNAIVCPRRARSADVLDPARRLVEHLADRVLEPLLPGEPGARRRDPCRPGAQSAELTSCQDLLGSAPRERRRARACPSCAKPARTLRLEQHRHLARRRDRQQARRRERERRRTRECPAARSRSRIAPRSTRRCSRPVCPSGPKRAGPDGAALERQPLEGRLRRRAGRSRPAKDAASDPAATASATVPGSRKRERRADAGATTAVPRRRSSSTSREVVADALQVAREVARRRVALVRVLGEAALDDPAKRRRRPRVHPRDGLRLVADDRGQRLGAACAFWKARCPRRHLVEDRAEARTGPSGSRPACPLACSGDM